MPAVPAARSGRRLAGSAANHRPLTPIGLERTTSSERTNGKATGRRWGGAARAAQSHDGARRCGALLVGAACGGGGATMVRGGGGRPGRAAAGAAGCGLGELAAASCARVGGVRPALAAGPGAGPAGRGGSCSLPLGSAVDGRARAAGGAGLAGRGRGGGPGAAPGGRRATRPGPGGAEVRAGPAVPAVTARAVVRAARGRPGGCESLG